MHERIEKPFITYNYLKLQWIQRLKLQWRKTQTNFYIYNNFISLFSFHYSIWNLDEDSLRHNTNYIQTHLTCYQSKLRITIWEFDLEPTLYITVDIKILLESHITQVQRRLNTYMYLNTFILWVDFYNEIHVYLTSYTVVSKFKVPNLFLKTKMFKISII